MEEEKKGLDNLDDFTLNVDSVIDDLFSPTKRIEIDPVTNTIKELKPEVEAQPQPSVAKTIQSPPKPQPKPDDSVTLELTPYSPSIPKPPVAPSTEQPVELKTEKIVENNLLKEVFDNANQAMMALDWEANDKNIYSSKEAIQKASSLLDANKHASIKELLKLIDNILSEMANDLKSIPPSTPKLAYKAFDAVHSLIVNDVTNPTELAAATMRPLQEIKNLIKLLEDEKKKGQSALLQPQEEPEELQLDLEEATAPSKPAPSMAKPSVFPISKPLSTTEHATEKQQQFQAPSEAAFANKESNVELEAIKKQIAQHTEQLARWIELLLPVEQLFQNKESFKKFYVFLNTIRKDMETQKGLLSAIYAGTAVADVQTQASRLGELANLAKAIQSEQKQEEVVEKCPWDQLVIGETDAGIAAFVASQIVYEGFVPWMTRKKCTGIDTFSLKLLKAWPWSDLKSIFKGELNKLTNQELANMELTLARPSKDITTVSQPYALVLFDNGKGVSALLKSQLTPISNIDSWQWQPSPSSEKTFQLGTLTKGEETIPVFGISK